MAEIIGKLAIELPGVALQALQALEDAGFETWAVGGCVRDGILGRPIADCDFATAAPWQDAEARLELAGFTVHRTGVTHGTITAVKNRQALEITTFRADGAYSDGRHPDGVSFVSSIEEDLARRDFTINAMAYHPSRGLLDPYGGLADLEAKVIRTVGEPKERFSEDGLRILRGLRFQSQLGFALDDATFQAMKACKMMLQKVSSERIVHEMDRLLLGKHPHDALMSGIKVLGAIMPEIVACDGFKQHTPYHIYDVWEHTAWVVEYSPATRLARWIAFFHDTGKPGAFFQENGVGHFYGHAKLSVIIAKEIMTRLKLAPAFIDQVITLVKVHDNPIGAETKQVKRTLAKLDGDGEMFETLLGLKRADSMAQSELSAPRLSAINDIFGILEEIMAAKEAFSIRHLAINGNDILAMGVNPGPVVGALLEEALEAVIAEEVPNDRAALLAFVDSRLFPMGGDAV